jgi:pilus assembly protein CpaB
MSRRTIVTICLALLFGFAAIFGVNQVYRGNLQPAKIETVKVLLAATDISRGRMVSPEQLKLADWPKDLLPSGALQQTEEAAGRAALSTMMKDEPVLDGKLAPRDAGRGVAALIPKGMRAFTIHTPTAASGVGGFILPGNKVDVLLTCNASGPNDTTGGGSTTTLLQCVEILAVDQRLDAPAENKVDPRDLRSVTLLVNPDQAAKLSLAMDKGTLHLSLRNPEDSDAADSLPVTLADIRFRQEAPTIDPREQEDRPKHLLSTLTVAVQPMLPLEVRTLRGNQHGVVYVDQTARSSSAQ